MARDFDRNNGEAPEFEEKVVTIKRVVKVVKGGRNSRFSALVVVGDGKGRVGAGIGKSVEIPEAIRKAKEDAMKSLITVPRDEYDSIPHDIIGHFGGATVLLKKAPEVTVLSQAARFVTYLRLPALRIYVPNPWAQTTSRMLCLLHLRDLSSLRLPRKLPVFAARP